MDPINISIRQMQSLDIRGEKTLFMKIIKDMFEHAGSLRPAPNWDLTRGGKDGGKYYKDVVIDGKCPSLKEEYEFTDEHYEEHFSTLSKMMDPWVGCTGMGSVTKDVAKEYIDHLHDIDNLGLMDKYFDCSGNLREGQFPLMITDMGTMMDLILISSALKKKSRVTIVEVGGGYGRLAEGFINLFGPEQVKYVLVDAVPVSLMYSELYMKDRFPDVNIGSYYRGDDFNLDEFPCYVVPAWHFERLNRDRFDVCINIQSMQEMSQHHVDYFLKLFDSIVEDRGLIYLSNEKDYVFRGKWNYPDSWQKIFKSRTPRSWTRNSPTELFTKQADDSSFTADYLLDFMYKKQLNDYDVMQCLKNQLVEARAIEARMESIEKSINTSVLLKCKKM